MAATGELLSLQAVELRRLIGSKRISPVELLEACIARIEGINPAVNAVTATCCARAREEAKAAWRANCIADSSLTGWPLQRVSAS